MQEVYPQLFHFQALVEHYAKQQAPQLQSGEVLTHRLPSQVWYLTPLITLYLHLELLARKFVPCLTLALIKQTNARKRMSMLMSGNAELRVWLLNFSWDMMKRSELETFLHSYAKCNSSIMFGYTCHSRQIWSGWVISMYWACNNLGESEGMLPQKMCGSQLLWDRFRDYFETKTAARPLQRHACISTFLPIVPYGRH